FFDRLSGDELLTNAEGDRAGRQEITRRHLVDAARGYQRDVRKRPAQGADISGAADVRAGKHLDEIGAGLPRRADFGGSQGSGYDDDVLLDHEFQDTAGIEPGARDEHGAGID